MGTTIDGNERGVNHVILDKPIRGGVRVTSIKGLAKEGDFGLALDSGS